MEMEQILKLVETVSNSTLSSFQYEEEGSCLILKQEPEKVSAQDNLISIPIEKSQKRVSSITQSAPTPVKQEPVVEQKGEVVTSPLVGVYYAQPSVGANPYVKVGDRVKKGQVIGIIEAMKLMNEVEASRDGEILEILVENEQLVEYGQGIVRIG